MFLNTSYQISLTDPVKSFPVELIKRELECTKESTELMEGLTALVDAYFEAVKDGWQLGQDLPVIITAAVQKLLPAFQGIEKLGSEIKDTEKFINSLFVTIVPLVFKIVERSNQKKEESK